MSDICLRCNREIPLLHLSGKAGKVGKSKGNGKMKKEAMEMAMNEEGNKKDRLPVPRAVVKDEFVRQDHEYDITTGQLQTMVNQFNQWWLDVHGLKLEFKFGMDEWKYVTPSEVAAARNDMLNQKFAALGIATPIKILDVFCGCGSDLITFLSDFQPPPKVIYGCDMKDGRKHLSEKNYNNFKEAWNKKYSNTKFGHQYNPRPINTDVEIKALSVSDLIYKEMLLGGVDLLYLDPPWTLNAGRGIAKPDELFEFLHREVFFPISEYTNPVNKPKFVVIKTRFGSQEMGKLKLDGYIFTDTLEFTPFNQTAYFHTLQSTTCWTDHLWHPSSKYAIVHPVLKKYHPEEPCNGPWYIEYREKEDLNPYWKDGKKPVKLTQHPIFDGEEERGRSNREEDETSDELTWEIYNGKKRNIDNSNIFNKLQASSK